MYFNLEARRRVTQILHPAAVLTRSLFVKQRGLLMRSRHMRSIAPPYMRRITTSNFSLTQ